MLHEIHCEMTTQEHSTENRGPRQIEEKSKSTIVPLKSTDNFSDTATEKKAARAKISFTFDTAGAHH